VVSYLIKILHPSGGFVDTSSNYSNLMIIGTIGVVYISMLEVKFYDYGKIN